MKDDDHAVPKILKKLASLLGAEVKNRKLEIPPQFGHGYCSGFIFNAHIRMLISNYELNADILVENPEIDAAKRMIFFKFQNVFPQTEIPAAEDHGVKMPSVLIATSRINTDDVISIDTNTATINIEIDAKYLDAMFYPSVKSPLLDSLTRNTQPFLFELMIYPSLQKVVDEIVSEPVDEPFTLFFLRIKAEELICRLLMELEKRGEKHLYALNVHDIRAIYKVKEQMLEKLEIPPVIGTLAVGAGMSPTKLKRLFRQIFGNSIFSYYQEFRMKEAARLLKEQKLSVSDVGYGLGFTNQSHFSRIFKKHIGMNPKQYSMK